MSIYECCFQVLSDCGDGALAGFEEPHVPRLYVCTTYEAQQKKQKKVCALNPPTLHHHLVLNPYKWLASYHAILESQPSIKLMLSLCCTLVAIGDALHTGPSACIAGGGSGQADWLARVRASTLSDITSLDLILSA